jgi:hypothetical protein
MWKVNVLAGLEKIAHALVAVTVNIDDNGNDDHQSGDNPFAGF